MEFAVIKTGGKQYKVSVGDVIHVEKLAGELKEGDKVVFDQVLLVDNGTDTTIGSPVVNKASVEGTFQKAGRNAKELVIKYKAKSNYFKKNGHRQPFHEIKITAIK